jgi:Exostosin family
MTDYEHKSIIPSYTKDDIITTDGYFNEFVNNPHVHYLKMDTFYVSDFHWRNNGHRVHGLRPIIITSHSDYPMTSSIYDGNNSRCKVWFSTNVACAKENLYALPLGISNYNESGNIFKLYGNLDQIIEARNHVYTKTSLCYMNFAIINYIQERQGVWDMFTDKSWIKCNTPSDTVDARMQYLTDIAQSKFTLCPRGNGVDTHRLWESLYLGSIPIVIDTVEHSQWKDLPILFINSWEEVTPAFLEAKWIEMIGKSWNLEKLKLSYWLKLIQENITKYESVGESS